jgi:hypothetical protein
MYHTESWSWTKAEIIRQNEAEMKSLKNKKAKTRRENKWQKYHKEFKNIMKIS